MAEMRAAIRQAKYSVRLEMYIFNPSPSAEMLREALIEACRRGVRVRVLADAFGSLALPVNYWDQFRAAGGQFRLFNPLALHRLVFRDHRKILVCDEVWAFVGGFNVGNDYAGDGIKKGWRDLGITIAGKLAKELAKAFDEMYACADFRHPPFARLRKSSRQKTVQLPEGKLLVSAPGRNCPFRKALHNDLKEARDVRIICAYFLPSWRLRRDLVSVVKRGGRVQLILPSKTDVPLSYLAGQHFYARLLRAGVEIYEYQPQILHAKILVVDDLVYVGSANLDSRSFEINYEVLLRLPNADLAAQGREIFEHDLLQCRRITLAEWKTSTGLWKRLKAQFACYFLSRIDPMIARYLWRKISVKRTFRRLKARVKRSDRLKSQHQRSFPQKATGMSHNQDTVPPLPKEEGRDEGEDDVV